MSAAEPCDLLLSGPLWSKSRRLPLTLNARLCNVRPRFIPKGQVGSGFRAISRNGRVLLASNEPIAELIGKLARVRLQVWHAGILPGDRPEPQGILLVIRASADDQKAFIYQTELAPLSASRFELSIELGGGSLLQFRRLGERAASRVARRALGGAHRDCSQKLGSIL